MAHQAEPSASPAIQEPSSNCRELGTLIDHMVDELDSSEITITFRDKFINQFQNMDEIIHLIKHYFTYLPFNDIKELLLIPEYGSTSRIHFHGIIRMKSKDKATLLLWLKKRFGRSTISMIRNPIDYKKYMLKENPIEYIYSKNIVQL